MLSAVPSNVFYMLFQTFFFFVTCYLFFLYSAQHCRKLHVPDTPKFWWHFFLKPLQISNCLLQKLEDSSIVNCLFFFVNHFWKFRSSLIYHLNCIFFYLRKALFHWEIKGHKDELHLSCNWYSVEKIIWNNYLRPSAHRLCASSIAFFLSIIFGNFVLALFIIWTVYFFI